MIDRSEVSRALAKAIAFKNAGREAMAHYWAAELVRLLECEGILDARCEVDRRHALASGLVA